MLLLQLKTNFESFCSHQLIQQSGSILSLGNIPAPVITVLQFQVSRPGAAGPHRSSKWNICMMAAPALARQPASLQAIQLQYPAAGRTHTETNWLSGGTKARKSPPFLLYFSLRSVPLALVSDPARQTAAGGQEGRRAGGLCCSHRGTDSLPPPVTNSNPVQPDVSLRFHLFLLISRCELRFWPSDSLQRQADCGWQTATVQMSQAQLHSIW